MKTFVLTSFAVIIMISLMFLYHSNNIEGTTNQTLNVENSSKILDNNATDELVLDANYTFAETETDDDPFQPIKFRKVGEIDTPNRNGYRYLAVLVSQDKINDVLITFIDSSFLTSKSISKIFDFSKRIELSGAKPDEDGYYTVKIPALFYNPPGGEYSLFNTIRICVENINSMTEACEYTDWYMKGLPHNMQAAEIIVPQ